MPKTNYSLRYLPIAVEDLTSIFDWIAENNPTRAAAFIEKLDKRIGNLEILPLSGRVPRNIKLKNDGYRVLILDNFLIFYVVRGQQIEIHRIVHGSRHLDDLL